MSCASGIIMERVTFSWTSYVATNGTINERQLFYLEIIIVIQTRLRLIGRDTLRSKIHWYQTRYHSYCYANKCRSCQTYAEYFFLTPLINVGISIALTQTISLRLLNYSTLQKKTSIRQSKNTCSKKTFTSWIMNFCYFKHIVFKRIQKSSFNFVARKS